MHPFTSIYPSRAFCVLNLCWDLRFRKHQTDLALPLRSLHSHEEARTLLVREERGPAEVEVTSEQRSWGGKSEPCEQQGTRDLGKGTASAKVLKWKGLHSRVGLSR